MRIALGESGARWIALAITISALGFLSQSMLTAPRVYYAMARDGLFFASVGNFSEDLRRRSCNYSSGGRRNRHRLFRHVWRDSKFRSHR